jgi:hypothetical protein
MTMLDAPLSYELRAARAVTRAIPQSGGQQLSGIHRNPGGAYKSRMSFESGSQILFRQFVHSPQESATGRCQNDSSKRWNLRGKRVCCSEMPRDATQRCRSFRPCPALPCLALPYKLWRSTGRAGLPSSLTNFITHCLSIADKQQNLSPL